MSVDGPIGFYYRTLMECSLLHPPSTHSSSLHLKLLCVCVSVRVCTFLFRNETLQSDCFSQRETLCVYKAITRARIERCCCALRRRRCRRRRRHRRINASAREYHQSSCPSSSSSFLLCSITSHLQRPDRCPSTITSSNISTHIILT